LSTPRLSEPHSVHVDIPFHDKLVDTLSAMKRKPGDYEEIKTALKIPPGKEDVFCSFFTEEPPRKYDRYTGDKVRMRYFGHACILIETSEVSILLDPLISYYGYPQEVHHFSEMHLPEEIDYVLITHNHQDHVLFETLLPLRHRIRNLVIPRSGKGFLQDPNLKLMFEHIGFKNVIEIDEMETLSFQNCAVTGLPFLGEHCDLNVQCKICHFVQVGEFRMLFAADSCNVEPKVYEHITSIVGGADVVFLGMECDGAPLSWLYGPLLPESLARDKDASRRLAGSNFERGRSLVEAFNPKEVYVYAMGQEPWVEFVSSIKYTDESNPIIQSNKLIDHLTARGIVAERLFGEKEILYNK
jgi:L-ascorbate metabolism protein UlaG (beta-lactamase superfamily)